ncbi:MAG: class I SAM-dependent methyltransferase [Rhizobiaceae bacterium]|nr:class I SAM-dependent methyltransferase [Rhizobiaceae bacterium]
MASTFEEKSEDLLKRAYALESDRDAKALYDDWAETYDQTMLYGLKYLTPRKTASLLKEAKLAGNARILDVGCGTGLAGEHLSGFGFRNIDALDYSPAMLRTAGEKAIDGAPVYELLIEADLNQKLPLEDNLYDAMICTGTFTHAHVGAECLHELFRILKPGGLFACTVHKDVWEPAGFSETVKQLAADGILKTSGMIMDIYFETDDEPQGWYILWEKLNS